MIRSHFLILSPQNTVQVNNEVDDLDQKYLTWLASRSTEEAKLAKKAYNFEQKFFGDMTIKDYEKELTVRREIVNYELKTVYGGISSDKKFSLFQNKWRIQIVKDLKGYMNILGKETLVSVGGLCYAKERIITIDDSYKDEDPVLLHEMIHAYEFMLQPYPYFHQYVMIKLYEKLLPLIPNLVKKIKNDLHIKNHVSHTPLLLLKSLDLDLKLEQPFGTVYGYGREAHFRKFNLYAVKYRVMGDDGLGEYKELSDGCRFGSVDEAIIHIENRIKQRFEDSRKKMIGFFPELCIPKPLEYTIFKKDKKHNYSKSVYKIREKIYFDRLHHNSNRIILPKKINKNIPKKFKEKLIRIVAHQSSFFKQPQIIIE